MSKSMLLNQLNGLMNTFAIPMNIMVVATAILHNIVCVCNIFMLCNLQIKIY